MRTSVLATVLLLVPLCAVSQPRPSDFNPSHEDAISHLETVGVMVEYSASMGSAEESFSEMRRAIEEYEEEKEDPASDSEETEPYGDEAAQLRSQVASHIREAEGITLRSTEGRKTSSANPVLRVKVEHREHDLEDGYWWGHHVTLTVRQEATLRGGQEISVDTYSMSYAGERMATEKEVSFGWAQETLDAMLTRFVEDLEASNN